MRDAAGRSKLRTMTAADIMVSPVTTVAPHTSVEEARALIRRARIRHLPVLDGGLLVGIVSDRDLRGATGVATVAERMTSTVFVLSPRTPLRQAAKRFRERRVGAMPVLSGRQVVGIVSVADVILALEESLRSPADASPQS